jgi:hypothetical protein
MQNIQGDERVMKERQRLLAEVFYLQLVLIAVAVVVQLFFDRTFILYVPAIIGGGGAFVFFILRYAMAGILFQRETDERVEAYKIHTKSIGYNIAVYTHVFGGFVILLLFDVIPWGALASWPVPALIFTIREIKKGVGGYGSNQKRRRGLKNLRLSTVFASLFFGAFMSWLNDTEGIADFVRETIIYAFLWGIPFYFLMALLFKISDRQADKKLKEAEEESYGEDG